MLGQSSILLVFCVVSGSLSKPPPTFLEYKDSLGQYSFGYSAPGSARSEVRSVDGSTRGSYSYVDDTGVIQSAQYTADGEHGFQVVATNLPQAPKPVEETPEVVAARLDHFKALEAASKLAEESPEIKGQQSEGAFDGKAADSIVIDGTPEASADAADQIQTKSADHSTDSEKANGETAPVATAKIGVAESQGESMQIMAKPDQIESSPIQSQTRAVQSSRPDVPVVTTSFVIPGRVNLHSRVELDQSGVAAARFSPEPLPAQMGVMQSPMLQGQAANFDQSMMTPAATKMMIAGSEKTGMNEASPLPAAPIDTKINSGIPPLQYSTAFVPSVIAAPHVYSLPYGIGINPIYQQYNPYRYFPYGIL